MAFTPKTWVGRSVEHPGRINLLPTGIENQFDVERAEGEIYNDGDLVSESNMNGLEGRIGYALSLSALAIDGVIKCVNLLHNWYFPNPVNQRGVSGTISTTGYFIDRWILTSGSVTLTSNGLTLNGTITQILEYEVGTDVTSSTSMYSGTATAAYNNSTKTFTITSSGGTIRAAKLEKGTVSTLANDAPPDRGEQLSICQRYQYAIKSYARYAPCWVTTNWIDFAISLPCNMRVNPTFAINNMVIQDDGTEITGFTFSSPSAASEPNVIVLRATKNAHGLTNPSLTTKTNTVSLLDANL